MIEKHQPDLKLTDIMMPLIIGLEVFIYTRNKLNLETPILVFSAAGQEKVVLQAFDLDLLTL